MERNVVSQSSFLDLHRSTVQNNINVINIIHRYSSIYVFLDTEGLRHPITI